MSFGVLDISTVTLFKKYTYIPKNIYFYVTQHPYPTEDEKRQIASQTNLTLLQVNNW
jgi:hypothetical protein